MLNTCSRDVLLELLRFLKRAYWPFSWDSGSGAHRAMLCCWLCVGEARQLHYDCICNSKASIPWSMDCCC